MPQSVPAREFDFAASARRVFESERDGLAAVAARVDGAFTAACRRILACRGRVVCTGMGKSGHIARKIAATLASTGAPSFFVHPAEASHGDLGMITPADVVMLLSNSGETAELKATVVAVKNNGCRLIGVSGNRESWLARNTDAFLYAGVSSEGGPLNRAPRLSVLAEMLTVQALSVALQVEAGLDPVRYVRCHPGGALGHLRENEK